jgi:hypothetical protein
MDVHGGPGGAIVSTTNTPNPPLLKASELPMPRLELRWDPEGAEPPEGYSAGAKCCRYLLVVPLTKWDIRREDAEGEQVRDRKETELGCTVRRFSGKSPVVWLDHKSIETPYRDHAHATWDSHILNIPAYVTAGEHAMFLEPRKPENLPPYENEVQS